MQPFLWVGLNLIVLEKDELISFQDIRFSISYFVVLGYVSMYICVYVCVGATKDIYKSVT